MTKTVCDICGKEMPTSKFADTIVDLNFCISSYGRIWDICNECRVSLNRCMIIRHKDESESGENEDKCKKCKYYINPDYTRCHECKAESEAQP